MYLTRVINYRLYQLSYYKVVIYTSYISSDGIFFEISVMIFETFVGTKKNFFQGLERKREQQTTYSLRLLASLPVLDQQLSPNTYKYTEKGDQIAREQCSIEIIKVSGLNCNVNGCYYPPNS